MKPGLFCAALVLVSAGASAAEPCADNFKAEGNFLSGKTYKTWAVVSGVRQDDAFSRALAFTAANGFTVMSSDKSAGVISAAQTVSYGKGKTVPLGIVFQPDAGNLKISMNYTTSGGVMSPEDAIKRHFCMTIAAASEGGSAAPAASNSGVVPPPNPGRQRVTAMRGFAAPTAAQQQGYTPEIGKGASGETVRLLVKDATPAIAAFIEKYACLADFDGLNGMNVYGAPGSNLPIRLNGQWPMHKTKYHDKTTCMSVARVNGWKAPARNALQFEVLYQADDSGETATSGHEAVRQPDGNWLFNY